MDRSKYVASFGFLLSPAQTSWMKESLVPRFRLRPVRFGTVILRSTLLECALIDTIGLAAGSSGWKFKLIGFSLWTSSETVCWSPSIAIALSTFLTTPGCSTDTISLSSTLDHGAVCILKCEELQA